MFEGIESENTRYRPSGGGDQAIHDPVLPVAGDDRSLLGEASHIKARHLGKLLSSTIQFALVNIYT